MSLFTIQNKTNEAILVNNTGKLSEDYFRFAAQYLKMGNLIYKDMNKNPVEMWKRDGFVFAAGYCLRLALELELKGKLQVLCENGYQAPLGQTPSHKLAQMFGILETEKEIVGLDEQKKVWLKEFLDDADGRDSGSDLFRYTFDEGEFRAHADEMLMYRDTMENLIRAYTMVESGTGEIEDENGNKIFPKYLSFNQNPQNSYIWQVDNFLLGEEDEIHTKYYIPLFEGFTGEMELLESETQQGNIAVEDICFPFLYLCRQDVELRMKSFLLETGQMTGGTVRLKGHNLKKLSRKVDNVINKHINEVLTDSDYQEAFGYLDDLSQLEGASDGNSYRYPVDFNGTYYSFQVKTVDLKHVYDCVVKIEDFLINTEYALAHKLGLDVEDTKNDECDVKDIEELPELLGDVDIA